MKCPHCQETLVMTDRQGVEIDYCPSCRGVWLDRGELDKLIERASSSTWVTPVRKDERDYDHGHGHGYGPKHKRKPKSMWQELFDFD